MGISGATIQPNNQYQFDNNQYNGGYTGTAYAPAVEEDAVGDSTGYLMELASLTSGDRFEPNPNQQNYTLANDDRFEQNPGHQPYNY